MERVGEALADVCKERWNIHSPWMPMQANYFTDACATSNGMALTNTYTMNWFLGRDDSCPTCDSNDPTDPYSHTPDGSPLLTPIALAQVEQPSSTMAFMLNQATSAYGNGFGCDYNTLEASDFINMLRWRAGLSRRRNIAFVDGHVKFIVAKEADSALCNGAPQYKIYNWTARGIWGLSGDALRDRGYPDGPIDLGCAQ